MQRFQQESPLGSGVFGLAITPDNTQIYVGQFFAAQVSVIDRSTLQIVNQIATTGGPRKIMFDRRGTTALITNEGGWVDFVK